MYQNSSFKPSWMRRGKPRWLATMPNDEQDIAPRERRPALSRVDAFDLPSAEERVRQNRHRGQEFPSTAEGQLPDDAGDESVRPVLVRYHPFQVRELPVEPAGGLEHLGPL